MPSYYMQELIERIDRAQGGLFKHQANLLRACKFVRKDWWFMVKVKTHCTTLFNTIYLCEDFYKTIPWQQCRWLIHEAVHLDQWKQKGSVKMIAEYAIKSSRDRIEAQAEAIAAQWIG